MGVISSVIEEDSSGKMDVDGLLPEEESMNESEFCFREIHHDEEFDPVAHGYQSEYKELLWTDGFNGLRQLFLTIRLSCTKEGTAILKYLANRYPGDNYPRTWEKFMGTPKEKVVVSSDGRGPLCSFWGG